MKKQDVEVFRQAVEMAASGDFADWEGIQTSLVEKGFRRAPDLLDGSTIRDILDARCQATRQQSRH